MEAELTRRKAITSFIYKSLVPPLEKAGRLLLVFLAAPMLGAAAFGLYQYAGTVTALLTGFAELGVGMWTTRALARNRDATARVLSSGLRLRALTAAPYVVLVGLFALTQEGGEARTVMLLMALFALASSFVDYLGAVFRGREDFRDEAITSATRAVLTTGGALIGLVVWRSVTGLAMGIALGGAIAAALGLALVKTRYRDAAPTVAGAHECFRDVLRESLPLWLSGLLATLYFRSDIVVVRAFAGDAEVGAYAAAYRIFEATMLLPAAIMAVAFPRLVRAGGHESSLARTRSLEAKLALAMLGLGTAVGAALVLADERLVRFLLGETFARSGASLRVLAYTVPVMFVSYATSYFVIARDQERRFVVVLGLMLVLNVGLNLVLVPRLGGVGAAWSTLVTEAALILGCGALLARPRRSATS